MAAGSNRTCARFSDVNLTKTMTAGSRFHVASSVTPRRRSFFFALTRAFSTYRRMLKGAKKRRAEIFWRYLAYLAVRPDESLTCETTRKSTALFSAFEKL